MMKALDRSGGSADRRWRGLQEQRPSAQHRGCRQKRRTGDRALLAGGKYYV